MRHSKARHQLNRFTSWHKATLKALARNLIIHQSIRTTLERAKSSRPLAEKLISLAKTDTLSAKREAFSLLGSHSLVSSLFKEIGPRFTKRTGGYTRIIHLGKRRGDDAEMVIFELTEIKKKETKKPKKAKEAKAQEEKSQISKDVSPQAHKPEGGTATETVVKEKPPMTKKPTKKFLGGLKNIFKKERDSL